jgi:hypothetical protein
MLSSLRISLLSLLLFGDRTLGLVAKRFPLSSYQLKEHHHVPKSWSRIGAAPPDHIISLRIGLAQSRFDELEKNLYEGMKTTIDLLFPYQKWLQSLSSCYLV